MPRGRLVFSPTDDPTRRELAPVPRVRDHLPPALAAVELGRERVHDVCTRWALGAIEDETQSVVTELVTNAVVHTATPIELSFALTPHFLHVAVRDGSWRRPRRRTSDEQRGYGLKLVDAFASRWGSHRTPDGKVVWAALRRP